MPADGAGTDETLYGSASTRIVRCATASAAGRVIWKEHLGPHATQRLRNERRLLMRLEGVAGVVQLAPAQRGADVLALVDCGAISLAQASQAGPLDIDTILSLACQLAQGLASVHRAGVIHRDINPANILLCTSGQAVLIDFDLAVLSTQQPELEPDGHLVGTLAYMAPEQTGRTGRAVDQRVDLYALGATLYEMAAGRPPFQQADALKLIHDHLVREPRPPWQVDARIPRGLSDIIVRLLAKAPEQRYQSAEGLLHDLQRLRSELQHGHSGVFALGERDFPARLVAPVQLVARDAERAALQKAFVDAMLTPGHTVLIDGPTGAGKSALINELRPAVAEAGGWFVYGKFDQYQRDTSATGALTQGLRALGRLLLTQSAEKVAAQREHILHGVGRNVGLIAAASPELALLLGTPGDAPEVDPRQTESQLQQGILDLLAVVASPACPLVFVVDDLQWAGSFSLRVFERIMTNLQLRGLLLVGIYRPDEVDAAHVVSPMLARWRQHRPPPLQITLENLTSSGVSEMIRTMLRLEPVPSHGLAEALGVLTGGNPFDTVEMINALRADGLLVLGEGGWTWDDAKVRSYVGRGNVVDLLAARINRLPATSRELLEFMSCLDNAVEISLLCVVAGLGAEELHSRLRAPLEDGLLVEDRTGGQVSVGFRHDRVQQAMLGAMDASQRASRQLAMARRLAHEPAYASEAAQQYLACLHLIHDPQEQRRAAHLLHGLGQVLASTGSYLLAERYMAAAEGLLAALGEPGDEAMRLAIDVARHRVLYGMGRVNESDPLYASIQARTKVPLDLVESCCLQMKSLDMRVLMRDAMTLGRSLLEQLGLHVPPDYADPATEQRLDALGEWIGQDSRIDHATRAQPHDPRLLGIHKLLARMVGSALYGADTHAFTWLLLESRRLWDEDGPSAHLVGCLGNLGGMLIARRQDFRTAYEASRHVITVGQALHFDAQTATARFLFSGRSCPWFEPLENALEHASRAFEVVQACGDPSFGSYFNIPVYVLLLETARTLDVCDAQVEVGLAVCRRTGNPLAAVIHACEKQTLRALCGQTKAINSLDDDQFNEQNFMATIDPLSPLHVIRAHVFLALISGEVEELVHRAEQVMAREHGIHAGFRAMHSYLCIALARAWRVQLGDLSAAQAQPLLEELETWRSWFAARAADQPYNFLHLLRLVEAEQAWALGDMWKAAITFDDAVLEVETRQRPWHRALITERAGLFNLAAGVVGAGRHLLTRARDHYQAWGAIGKVKKMQREHPFLQPPARSLSSHTGSNPGPSITSSGVVSPDTLDLVGVLQASQALSSETSLERLTARVSEVLASLSGATKVMVLSCNEEQWWLLSHAPTLPSMRVTQAAQEGLLPLSAFAYTQRTAQALIVDDATSDDRFSRDPYFAGLPVCSLLLVPIAGQAGARGMLLLENRLGRAAFNSQRLDAVMLIAGQLAVSLGNAQLYERLEQRVQERTRELQDTQAQLVTTARRAGMAEVANNVLHNVGNVLNSINVSADVLRDTLGRSRVDGLTRAVELINEHQHDLSHFTENDPRGKKLWPYLNQLAGALRAEREQALSDLDRLSLGVDHIMYVVSTQQAHSGPSSVVEMTSPEALVEEALHLTAEAVKRSNLTVERRYQQVPDRALDRQRLVQVLVNLIGNAAQAMQVVPVALRQLTLEISLSDAEGGAHLRLAVHDAGEGIEPENLTRIFAHGFTTRASGHGFGLHSSAVAVAEMGGKLIAHSDGPGRGAIFTIDLP